LKVSVIIPVKNRVHLLKETLETVVNQSLKPYEIIVVDDNSEEDISRVLEMLDYELTYLMAGKTGPGAARNSGLKEATGDYIQFFDSDDLMTLNKLEEQCKILKQTGADLVYSPYVKAFKTKNKWVQRDVIMNSRLGSGFKLLNAVAKGWCPITQSVLFTKCFIDKLGGWREDIFTHEDLDFWFRVAQANPRTVHTDKCAVLYRQHGEQLTDKETAKVLFTENHLKVLNDWENLVKEKLDYISNSYFNARKYYALKFLSHKRGELINKTHNRFASVLMFRILNKFERMQTRSNWERIHGVDHSEEKFKNFVKGTYIT